MKMELWNYIVLVYVDDKMDIGTGSAIADGVTRLFKIGGDEYRILFELWNQNAARTEIWMDWTTTFDQKSWKMIWKESGEVDDVFKTQRAPGFKVIRQVEKKRLLNDEDQKEIRAVIGILFYLVKYST